MLSESILLNFDLVTIPITSYLVLFFVTLKYVNSELEVLL